MPTLKNLTCNVKWTVTKQPLKEFGESYVDGRVDCYIAVPDSPPDFYIQLTSDGYIAPGLAMFVYIDGVYQCNRNRRGLQMPDGIIPKSLTEVNFVVRQKENFRSDGTLWGKKWKLTKTTASTQASDEAHPATDGSHVGWIDVVVLRCNKHNPAEGPYLMYRLPKKFHEASHVTNATISEQYRWIGGFDGGGDWNDDNSAWYKAMNKKTDGGNPTIAPGGIEESAFTANAPRGRYGPVNGVWGAHIYTANNGGHVQSGFQEKALQPPQQAPAQAQPVLDIPHVKENGPPGGWNDFSRNGALNVNQQPTSPHDQAEGLGISPMSHGFQQQALPRSDVLPVKRRGHRRSPQGPAMPDMHDKTFPPPYSTMTKEQTLAVPDTQAVAWKLHAEHLPVGVAPDVHEPDRITHQLSTSKPEPYMHKLAKPQYLDTFKKPYAVFRFKYRSEQVLESLLRMQTMTPNEKTAGQFNAMSSKEPSKEPSKESVQSTYGLWSPKRFAGQQSRVPTVNDATPIQPSNAPSQGWKTSFKKLHEASNYQEEPKPTTMLASRPNDISHKPAQFQQGWDSDLNEKQDHHQSTTIRNNDTSNVIWAGDVQDTSKEGRGMPQWQIDNVPNQEAPPLPSSLWPAEVTRGTAWNDNAENSGWAGDDANKAQTVQQRTDNLWATSNIDGNKDGAKSTDNVLELVDSKNDGDLSMVLDNQVWSL